VDEILLDLPRPLIQTSPFNYAGFSIMHALSIVHPRSDGLSMMHQPLSFSFSISFSHNFQNKIYIFGLKYCPNDYPPPAGEATSLQLCTCEFIGGFIDIQIELG